MTFKKENAWVINWSKKKCEWKIEKYLQIYYQEVDEESI